MDFTSLSTDEQVALLMRAAQAGLRAWDLGQATLALLKYRENAVFAVSSATGAKAALRLHRPGYRRDEHIRSELAWMSALSQAGIATPAVIATRDGDVMGYGQADDLAPRQCDLLGWVDGAPLGTLEGGVDLDEGALRDVYRTLGETAARIHAHGQTWRVPPSFQRPEWNIDSLIGDDPTFGKFWELNPLDDSQRTVLFRAREIARERLAQLDSGASSYGLTHGDLVPDNILAGPAGLRVVDFDDCGASWYGFELATSIFPLSGSPAFEPARDAYVEGYGAVSSIAALQLEAMPDFLMARALSYLGWPVGRPEMETGRNLAPMLAYMVTEYAQGYLELRR